MRTLTDADVAAIADALTQRQQPAAANAALKVADVMARLGVSRDFVYAHKSELGAFRPGGGRRGQLRFEAAKVEAARERWRVASEEPARPRRRPGPPATTRGVDLLPIRSELA